MICPTCEGDGFPKDAPGHWSDDVCVDCQGQGSPTVDVIVVNYRTPGDLGGFLDSLDVIRDDTKVTLTVVDVDPEDPAPVVAITPERSLLLQTDTNVGYGRACNMAATKCMGDVLAFFNADIVLREGALEHCVETLLSDRRWGVLGPKQVDSKGRIRHAGIFGSRSKPRHRGWNERDSGQYRTVEEAVTVSGSAYFMRRSCLDELTRCKVFQEFVVNDMGMEPPQGPFLPTEHFYEETFVSYHAEEHGWGVVYCGSATIVHEWHRASPVGSQTAKMKRSQATFRSACRAHGIPHD